MIVIQAQVKKYRHEIKLLLSQAEYISAAAKLRALLPQDEYTTASGDYFIRSLYFDDCSRTSYFEKLAGLADRKKYRMRIYNFADSVIKLECKEKKGDRIHKQSVSVPRRCADNIIAGDFSGLSELDNDLAHKVYSLATGNGLAPSIVVDYDREAYIHPISNVRLTFDKNLHAGLSSTDIFDKDILTLPIFPDGSVIFEIKYDDVIPQFLAQLVSSCGGSKSALSKFCLCRDALSNFKPQYTK